MPVSPRAAAVGIGAAVSIALGTPMILGIVATHAVGIRKDRAAVAAQLESIYGDMRREGLENDTLPQLDAFNTAETRVIGVTGRYAVFEDDFPLHRLPRNVIALIQARNDELPTTIDTEQFAQPGTLGDVVGASQGIGTGIVFADGLVLMLADSTPLGAIYPFVRRDTAVKLDRIQDLGMYAIR